MIGLIMNCASNTFSQTPCSTTSYVRGQPLLTWNYDLKSIPKQINKWISSLDISAGDEIAQFRHFQNSTQRLVSEGLAWHWRNTDKIMNKMKKNGFLYGKVDRNGKFSGKNITFIYPDFLTGLRGTFEEGVMRYATAVDVVAERCNNGVKELKLEHSKHNSDVIWENTGNTLYQYGKNPRVMDPQERKSVYVGQSTNPRANQGLFARKFFEHGNIVSYYGGERLFLKDIVYPNMTVEESAVATPYVLILEDNMLVDVKEKYRNITEYRTTLGHKANHKFKNHNTVYQIGVNHPVLGNIGCLMAVTEIDPGEEIFVNYNYNLEAAVPWYREEYNRLYGKSY